MVDTLKNMVAVVKDEFTTGQRILSISCFILHWWGYLLVDAVIAKGTASEVLEAIKVIAGMLTFTFICIMFKDAPRMILEIFKTWLENRKAPE